MCSIWKLPKGYKGYQIVPFKDYRVYEKCWYNTLHYYFKSTSTKFVFIDLQSYFIGKYLILIFLYL